MTDLRSGVRWPSAGDVKADGMTLKLVDKGRSLEITYKTRNSGESRTLGDLLGVTGAEEGAIIVPCREGLLVHAGSGKSFRRTFGTSDYEGCHMNMLGLLKSGSALVVDWDDAQVFPELQGTPKRLTAEFRLRKSGRTLRITPLGKGDWNAVARGYRRIAERKKLVETLGVKIRRNPKAALMIGASNVKLWTCLARKMNEASTAEESVTVRWTFDQAAQIAEHLHNDLGLDRCLFMIGGWTQGGYDCRHPDNLPANPECGGNKKLAEAIARIQKLNFVASLHDNYQDMYRDARSWDPKVIEKRPNGSLVTGGRWLGGRAYMVCSSKQLTMASRQQNLPQTAKLFGPWSYFIDTTCAVGPRECHDPSHPVGRNEDIAWKIRLSDYARKVFGLFGSECGREWALSHSDFFEGLVGVSGKYYHNLRPEAIGATVIPFWEMVYHDSQIAWGKYGYSPAGAAEYMAHHVLCARPLHYHTFGNGLYWEHSAAAGNRLDVIPRITNLTPAGESSVKISYAWDVRQDIASDWRVFVHFGLGDKIFFQDDHLPDFNTSKWRKGRTIKIGPHTVGIPRNIRDKSVDVFIGLFSTKDMGFRAVLPGCDSRSRMLLGRLHLKPKVVFVPAAAAAANVDPARYVRSDSGWAKGLHPTDVFIKNTHEVLGPLHTATAHNRLTDLKFLTADRTVRLAVYGSGPTATTVLVNFGRSDAKATSEYGGEVTLPPWGFVIDSPRFAAFSASGWGGRKYPGGAMFTLRSLDNKTLSESGRVRVFHAFGDPNITWRGRDYRVQREKNLLVR